VRVVIVGGGPRRASVRNFGLVWVSGRAAGAEVTAAQHPDGAVCHRAEVATGVHVVTGAGGRGMTLSPALAERTFEDLA
jgi:hypothetical protein